MFVRPGRVDTFLPDPVSPLKALHGLESFYIKRDLCEEFCSQFFITTVFGFSIDIQGAFILIPFCAFFRGKRVVEIVCHGHNSITLNFSNTCVSAMLTINTYSSKPVPSLRVSLNRLPGRTKLVDLNQTP